MQSQSCPNSITLFKYPGRWTQFALGFRTLMMFTAIKNSFWDRYFYKRRKTISKFHSPGYDHTMVHLYPGYKGYAYLSMQGIRYPSTSVWSSLFDNKMQSTGYRFAPNPEHPGRNPTWDPEWTYPGTRVCPLYWGITIVGCWYWYCCFTITIVMGFFFQALFVPDFGKDSFGLRWVPTGPYRVLPAV